MQFCKTLAWKITEDGDAPKDELFIRHYVSIIKEDPAKRSFMCELIYAHSSHDLALRIKVIQDLKKALIERQEDTFYCCLAHMIAQEKTFNEEWFDVFLYYALIGLQKPRPYIRVYSINILNSIANHSIDAIMDVSEKLKPLSHSHHWEIKAQCLLFGCLMLKKL